MKQTGDEFLFFEWGGGDSGFICLNMSQIWKFCCECENALHLYFVFSISYIHTSSGWQEDFALFMNGKKTFLEAWSNVLGHFCTQKKRVFWPKEQMSWDILLFLSPFCFSVEDSTFFLLLED